MLLLMDKYLLLNFNSSMVRLRAWIKESALSRMSTFQFQYGAIESIMDIPEQVCNCKFQFQYGAIERLYIPTSYETIMEFQFQYGAIES